VLSKSPTTGLPPPSQALVSFADRQAQAGVTSDLRREATTLVERLVRLLAIRLVEAEVGRQGVSTAGGRGGPGRVEIIPK
jgi:hypothetical protein